MERSPAEQTGPYAYTKEIVAYSTVSFFSATHVLVDTNIIIGLMNGSVRTEDLLRERSIIISAVTIAEIYALSGMSKEEERRIDLAISFLEVVLLDVAIAKRAGHLARTRRRTTSDLLIAATAIELGVPLLTKNTKDFRGIPGLQLAPEL